MLDKRVLYILSVLFFGLVGLRYNVAPLAWIVYVPLLLLVRESHNKKEWFIIAILLQIGYFLQIVKIITEPMPVAFALMFSIPSAFGTFVFVWIFEKLRRRVGDIWGVLLFASLMSLMEWINYDSAMGSWGTLFYTQADTQAFMQFASLFGMSFGSFFLYFTSAFVSAYIASKERKNLHKMAVGFATIFLLFYIYGVVRIANGINPSTQIVVSAISSELDLSGGLPTKEQREKNSERLFRKTEIAIARGAKLIAWSEGATVVAADEREIFRKRLKKLSLENNVSIVASYIVPIEGLKKFENKYLFISRGKILDEYYKLHPAPGEGSLKGENLAKVLNIDGVKISGAICYDFDFPSLSRALAKGDPGLIVVPSSDWRGIDNIHAQQAMLRAIEGGFSLLRPVSGATTYAYDAYGNIRASMNFFEKSDHIMVASLPTQRLETLYSKIGDSFVLLLWLVVIYILFLAFRLKKGYN